MAYVVGKHPKTLHYNLLIVSVFPALSGPSFHIHLYVSFVKEIEVINWAKGNKDFSATLMLHLCTSLKKFQVCVEKKQYAWIKK